MLYFGLLRSLEKKMSGEKARRVCLAAPGANFVSSYFSFGLPVGTGQVYLEEAPFYLVIFVETKMPGCFRYGKPPFANGGMQFANGGESMFEGFPECFFVQDAVFVRGSSIFEPCVIE